MESCWDWITNYLYEERENRIMDNKPSSYPIYSELTKDDTVKVLKHRDESKYVKDIDLDGLYVDKTLSKKYNVYYKYLYFNMPRRVLSDYDIYELISLITEKIYKTGSHILIIIKDKHDKDYEERYLFQYPYDYKPIYPTNINYEHLELCRKLISKLV